MSQPAAHLAAIRVLTPERLCQEYAAAICRFAALLSPTPDEAADLAQETLLRAVRKLDQFDPRRGSMEAWLWRIAANTARDLKRRATRRTALWRRLTTWWQEPTTSVEARALDAVTSRELVAAVHSLPARDRLLIGLRFGADLDLAAVGAAVGIGEAAAGRAVLRALLKLRAQLEAHRDE